MKRLLVIVAFVVVVLCALAGGVYLLMVDGGSHARSPVVADLADDEPDAPLDGTGGPLSDDGGDSSSDAGSGGGTTNPVDDGSEDATNPDGSDSGGTEDAGETRNPDAGDNNGDVDPDGTKPPPPVAVEIDPTEGYVTLAGRVITDVGDPYPGAGIMLKYIVPGKTSGERGRSPSGTQTRSIIATDNDGFYRIGVKLVFPNETTPFSITLWAQAGNDLRSTEEQTISINIDETREGIDFTIARGGELSGRVVNHEFEAMSRAMVYAQRTDQGSRSFTVVTENDGTFTFTGIRPGEYRIFASADGYQPAEEMPVVTVAPGDSVAMTEDVMLKPFTAIKLRLVANEDQPNGQFGVIFYNADGKASRSTAKADSKGVAMVGGVPDDAVEMEVELKGYEKSARIRFTVVKDSHTDVGEITLVPAARDGE